MPKTPDVKDLKKLGAPAVAVLVGNRGAAKIASWVVNQFLANATNQTKTLAEAGVSLLAALVVLGFKKGNANLKLAAVGATVAGIESLLGLVGPLPLLSGYRQSQVRATRRPPQLRAAQTDRQPAQPAQISGALMSATGEKSPVYRNTSLAGVESAY